jgi:hypothetical protein
LSSSTTSDTNVAGKFFGKLGVFGRSISFT